MICFVLFCSDRGKLLFQRYVQAGILICTPDYIAKYQSDLENDSEDEFNIHVATEYHTRNDLSQIYSKLVVK